MLSVLTPTSPAVVLTVNVKVNQLRRLRRQRKKSPVSRLREIVQVKHRELLRKEVVNMRIILLAVFCFGCVNKKQPNAKALEKEQTTFPFSNGDTTCYTRAQTQDLKEITFLHACCIKYSNALMLETAKSVSVGRLSPYINIYGEKDELQYSIVDNTIMVRILFMTQRSGYKVEPISVRERNGVILLGFKGSIAPDSGYTPNVWDYYEMSYKFKVPHSYSKKIIVKVDG